MKRKKLFLFVCIIIIVSALSYLTYYNINIKSILKRYDSKIEQLNSENVFLKSVKTDFKTYFAYENYTINSNFILTSTDRNKIPLNKIIDNKSKFVVRFSYLNCESCVEYQIKLLKEYEQILNSNNVIILVSDFNLRNAKLLKIISSLKYPLYLLESNIIPGIDDLNEPYFFIIDNTFRANLIFIPHKEIPELSNYYMNKVSQRFF